MVMPTAYGHFTLLIHTTTFTMGQKRSRDDARGPSKEQASSPYTPMFEGFRKELDEHHDRRERIVKASRDITASSKKMHVIGLGSE